MEIPPVPQSRRDRYATMLLQSRSRQPTPMTAHTPPTDRSEPAESHPPQTPPLRRCRHVSAEPIGQTGCRCAAGGQVPVYHCTLRQLPCVPNHRRGPTTPGILWCRQCPQHETP